MVFSWRNFLHYHVMKTSKRSKVMNLNSPWILPQKNIQSPGNFRCLSKHVSFSNGSMYQGVHLPRIFGSNFPTTEASDYSCCGWSKSLRCGLVSRWDSYQLHAGCFSLHNYFGGEITPGKHTPLIDFQPLKKGRSPWKSPIAAEGGLEADENIWRHGR